MEKTKTYRVAELDLGELVDDLTGWLSSEGFNTQVLSAEDGSTVVQVAKQGTWRKFVGMSTALNVALRHHHPSLVVEIGAGRWMDKAAAGTVSLFLLWPLAVTSAFGAWSQLKMPEKVLDRLDGYLGQPRNMVVELNPETQRVKAATEKVTAPEGVKIKVRRARTIEHTLDLRWERTEGRSVSFEGLDTISHSVHRKIQESNGRSYSESETQEYEVEVDGGQAREHTLVWFDRWRTGTVHFHHSGEMREVPFRFREQTELEVLPGA